MRESFRRPMEARRELHLLHRGVNAADLRETERMNRLGRHPRGRFRLDQMPVQSRSARHLRKADTRAGMRQVIVPDEVAQAHVRWYEPVANERGIGGGEALAIRGREIAGKPRDGFVEGRTLDTLRNQGIQLTDDRRHDEARVGDAVRESLAHAADGAIKVDEIAVETLQIVIVIGDRLERGEAVAGRDIRNVGLDAQHLVDGALNQRFEQSRLEAIQIFGSLEPEDIVAHPVLGAEGAAVDAGEAREIVQGRLPLGGEIIIGDQITEMGRVAQVAARERRDRISLEARLIARGKQCVQTRRGCCCGGCGVCCGGCCRGCCGGCCRGCCRRGNRAGHCSGSGSGSRRSGVRRHRRHCGQNRSQERRALPRGRQVWRPVGGLPHGGAHRLLPSTFLTVKVSTSTSSRQRTLTAAIFAPVFGWVPIANG